MYNIWKIENIVFIIVFKLFFIVIKNILLKIFFLNKINYIYDVIFNRDLEILRGYEDVFIKNLL